MNVELRDESDGQRLRELIGAERDAVKRDRLRAALLAAEGNEAVAIAGTLGRSRRFVQAWAYAYAGSFLRCRGRGARHDRFSRCSRSYTPSSV